MGLLTQAPHGEPGKSGAACQDILEVADRNRLGLGHPVHVDKLGQHELDIVFLQKGLGLVEVHGHYPFSELAWTRPG